MSRSTHDVFEDHLQKRMAGKLEEDIAANFAPDVILLTGTGMLHGQDGVRTSARQLEHYLGGTDFTFTSKLVEGEYAFLEWRGENKHKVVCDGADSFVIRDGKIVMQSIHYTVQDK